MKFSFFLLFLDEDSYVVWRAIFYLFVRFYTCVCVYMLLWNEHSISLLFARSRLFNLHLSRSLLLPFLVYFSVLANVSNIVFGPFFASPVVASLIEHIRIHKFNHPQATDRRGRRRREKKKNEWMNERNRGLRVLPGLSFSILLSLSSSLCSSLIQLRGQSSLSLRKRHICSVVLICFLDQL